MVANLKPPKWPHGQRLLISRIDEIVHEEPERPWIAVPVDDCDLSKGYKDITFKQFSTGANIAAQWLLDNLDFPSTGFPAFAYNGGKDYRYSLFALAAGKLGYQMVLPQSTMTIAAQQRILTKKDCQTYLYAQSESMFASQMAQNNPRIKTILVPDLEFFTGKEPAEVVAYRKSWQEAKSDPWLVFHTSGTTGFPKVVTYSQHMLSTVDIAAGLEDIGETHLTRYQKSRVYTPIPIMHKYVPMLMMLSITTFANTTVVFGPANKPPTPAIVRDIFTFTHVDGAMMIPALIDAMCRNEETLILLRNLSFIQYAGAPMSINSGKLLSPYVRIFPAVGSTDIGPYFFSMPNAQEDWDYVCLQPHSGAIMEHRIDSMYELVFVRNPECAMQTFFEAYPHLDRFETKDMWEEHPIKKGHWKITGRSDDYVKLGNAHGLYVTPLERIIAEHPLVQNVVIGGHSGPRAIILVELIDGRLETTTDKENRMLMIASLKPFIERANLGCHECVRLDPNLVVFATPDRPWPRTIKDTILRSQTLKLYEHDIAVAYRNAGY